MLRLTRIRLASGLSLDLALCGLDFNPDHRMIVPIVGLVIKRREPLRPVDPNRR